jgi:hypothetical protein
LADVGDFQTNVDAAAGFFEAELHDFLDAVFVFGWGRESCRYAAKRLKGNGAIVGEVGASEVFGREPEA